MIYWLTQLVYWSTLPCNKQPHKSQKQNQTKVWCLGPTPRPHKSESLGFWGALGSSAQAWIFLKSTPDGFIHLYQIIGPLAALTHIRLIPASTLPPYPCLGILLHPISLPVEFLSFSSLNLGALPSIRTSLFSPTLFSLMIP